MDGRLLSLLSLLSLLPCASPGLAYLALIMTRSLRSVWLRVLVIQVATLLVLWLLQAHYGAS